MSIYHIIFLFLLLGVLIEYKKGDTPKWLFRFTFLLLSLFMAFRYGQGTDYYSYCSMYVTMPVTIQEILAYNFAPIEIGWRFLCAGFKLLHVSFKGFVFILSLAEMLLLWRFVSRYCKNKMLALFLSYHTLYLTYFFSAMRQALVIAVFLGLLLEWLLEGKYLRYSLCVLVCSSMHYVSIILLVPVILHRIRLSFTQMVCLTVIGYLAGMVLSLVHVGQMLHGMGLMEEASAYLGETDISVVALMERVLSYIVVVFACYLYMDGREPDYSDQIFNLFKIYSLGIMLYGLLMWSPLISSRLVYMFKLMEIPLICTCIAKCRRARGLVLLYCIGICSMLYVKNIGSYLTQGRYLDFTVQDYPYVSIFNHEKIAEYRKDTGYMIDWLDFEFDQEYIDKLKIDYQNLPPHLQVKE